MPASSAKELPQTPDTPPPPQMYGAVQVPQSAVRPPQPSAILPQLTPGYSAQVFLAHGDPPSVSKELPQTLALPPPPQISPALVQVPQSMVAPQPSPARPQLYARSVQVFGLQPPTPPSAYGLPHL